MKVKNYRDVDSVAEVPGVTMRWVINDKDGAPNFALRVLELEPGASSPFHNHGWEHEVFVLSGTGAVRDAGDVLTPIREGDAVLVLPEETHQFVNQGEDTLRFVCLIPNLE